MERAGRLLGKLKNLVQPEALARAAWPEAVGPRIAAHCTSLALYGRRLVIEVEDPLWQRQLSTMQQQIVARFEQILGPGVVDEIYFRTGLPRRGPHREAASTDEADSIQDPVLRHLYKVSRARSSG